MRFFVLTFDAVYYFKFEEDFLAGRPAKGRIQLDKSIFFCEHDPASGDHLLQFRSLARVSEPLPATDARPGTLWADRRAGLGGRSSRPGARGRRSSCGGAT